MEVPACAMSFEPASVEANQDATLKWTSEGAIVATVTPWTRKEAPVGRIDGARSGQTIISQGIFAGPGGIVTCNATLKIGPRASILAAVAPISASSTLHTRTIAFASILNAGTVAATKCSIQLPAGVPANFKYQTTDPTTNTPIGTVNTPVDIPAGATQSFYFAITPTAVLTKDIALIFLCENSNPAPSIPGFNTFLLTVLGQ
jgi:hypothetical protein